MSEIERKSVKNKSRLPKLKGIKDPESGINRLENVLLMTSQDVQQGNGWPMEYVQLLMERAINHQPEEGYPVFTGNKEQIEVHLGMPDLESSSSRCKITSVITSLKTMDKGLYGTITNVDDEIMETIKSGKAVQIVFGLEKETGRVGSFGIIVQ